MNYHYLLPLSSSPWQVFTLDMTIDGEGFQAQVELRYLPAPDRWFVSIWDHAAGELLVNMIPLVCSRGGAERPAASVPASEAGKGPGVPAVLTGNG